jgi:ubiquitin carboxyl-terminal hydrolase 9/13
MATSVLETRDNAASYGMPESLFTSLKGIFESVVASQCKMGLHHFLDVLLRCDHEMFRTAMHQDAHEFLNNLLLNEVVASVEAESSRQLEADRSSRNVDNDDPEVVDQALESSSSTITASSGSKTLTTSRWVHELFEGTLTSETPGLTCEKVSQRDEVFF